MAVSSGEATSRRRRENVSAHAPDGISSRKEVSDQMTKSVEIWPAESPWSANRSA